MSAMKTSRNMVLAGALAISLAAVAGLSAAAISKAHVLTVRLPGGGVERIAYVGDRPPQILLRPQFSLFGAPSPAWAPFEQDRMFAELDRASAAMDQQAAAMLLQARTQAAIMSARGLPGPGDNIQIASQDPPPGVQGYSVVSTMTTDGSCTRSAQYEFFGDGHRPQVVKRVSGDCGPSQARIRPSAPHGAAAPTSPMIQTRLRARDVPSHPDRSLIHTVSDTRN